MIMTVMLVQINLNTNFDVAVSKATRVGVVQWSIQLKNHLFFVQQTLRQPAVCKFTIIWWRINSWESN